MTFGSPLFGSSRVLARVARRRIEGVGERLKPLRERRRTAHKPAQLFRFAAGRFKKLKDRGILFPFYRDIVLFTTLH
jgi:hypothetical protein